MLRLYTRSAEAAGSTQSIIQKIVHDIGTGSESVEAMSKAFESTLEHNDKVFNIIDKIEKSSAEQSQAVNKINQEIGELETITRDNDKDAILLMLLRGCMINQSICKKLFVNWFL
jgi:methyl-accepting chemotaxis protein